MQLVSVLLVLLHIVVFPPSLSVFVFCTVTMFLFLCLEI